MLIPTSPLKSHMEKRIKLVLRPGDAHFHGFRAISAPKKVKVPNFFLTPPPILRPRPSQKLSLSPDVLTFSARFTYTLPGTSREHWKLAQIIF